MDIQVQDISKIYGVGESQVTALNHANMTIHVGDFISIIGPSGSGKSTLLHIVSGLDKPTLSTMAIPIFTTAAINSSPHFAARR
jgi:putative ABC transport system ATP-binding protein